ncbi:chromatin-remodeling ATPase INO80 isoform X2 [Arctopsyche grandis]|uniref:chromatin-remodeling ATPase INO80 isoform X2 n=1 Tax=Arctopsyche grandis TaxID=121162 RepID=UPI00406D9745
MAEKPVTVGTTLRKNDIAKPLHLQRLEAALDIRPYMNYMDKIFENESSSENHVSSNESEISDEDLSQGNKIVHGVVTTKEERRSDKSLLYNLDHMGIDDERSCLHSVLLSDSPSDDSDVDSEFISEAYLSRMLKDHMVRQKYAAKYHKNPENAQYMYYGAGLLSTYDRWPSLQREMAANAVHNSAKKRRPKTSTISNVRSRPSKVHPPSYHTDKDDWDDGFSVSIKDEPEDSDRGLYAGMSSRAAARARKRAAMAKKPEVLAARRRKFWQLMVKKEMGKVQRTRVATHKDTLQNCKRMATLCTKHHRQKAMQSQKNMKETVWRCKRLTREMQAYWKRYDRVERETRRRMEKEAEEQRKMDVELIEAKRQQRKLNFLITQTELYAHFMSRKIGKDTSPSSQLRILSQLDDDRGPKHLAHLDTYDVDAMKEKAARNASDAFNADRSRKQKFDQVTGVKNKMEPEPSLPGGEHVQPNMFQGTLKGYQLKGMNWLANLYDQGISGILADEMGLGKTVQCIAFLCHVAERLGVWGPFLVVSPASTLHNWQQEMERFVPDFKVVPYWGSPNERKILRQFWERKDLHTRDAAFHVVITSYQLVVSDLKYLNRIKWQYMILDEAQAIKSSASLRWKLLLSFSCRNRLLLSGTPIQNSMAELWALLHFIMPTLFDSHDEFNEWFSKDIESHAENKTTIDEKHLSRLHMILKPFMLRRIKKDVENELSDKIEVMVYCPLTTRQKLLYIALKKKIQVEDLLHFSTGGETGHNVDKNFTSNLMNLVMQFRKVCNHPELFERRDVKSPFFLKCDDYVIPKIVAEDGILAVSFPSKKHLFFNKFCIFATEYINNDLFRNSETIKAFSFTRFINLSAQELYNITIGEWIYVITYLLNYKRICDNLRYRYRWWSSLKYESVVDYQQNSSIAKLDDSLETNNTYYDAVLTKYRLIVCPYSRKSICFKNESTIWNDFLFTYPLNIAGPMTFCHTDHKISNMPETIDHRRIRSKHLFNSSFSQSSTAESLNDDFFQLATSSKMKKMEGEISDNVDSMVPEFLHRPLLPQIRSCQPTNLPLFLFSSTVKVHCGERTLYACSSFSANRWISRDRNCVQATVLAPPPKPPPTASCLLVPNKQTLVTDAGKLNVLDGLLTRLKSQSHRVLIYSQMTKMIDLLEEYMWHRKHKYMRLDGSSKISARRDMVADFQAKTDIFVFLLSTRAGGLGINLTAADTVIFYDSDWNPTVDQQAMDRAHRLGQTKQVTVYRLICKGTIEERIMQRAREKSEIQRMVISGGNFKPDTLKPKEVVSLLLDDEELELKYRQRAEEKKMVDENRLDFRSEKERKRKLYGLSLKVNECKRQRGGSGGESGPCSPEPEPDLESELGAPFDDTSNEALVVDVESPSGSTTPGLQAESPIADGVKLSSHRRGPGRPRARGTPPGGAARVPQKGRRNRGPLLVPLGTQAATTSQTNSDQTHI